MPNNVKATFINLVKITEVKNMDYMIHLFNSYSGKVYVFKIYKSLWDKAMEIRKIQDLDITVTNDEKEEEDKIKEKAAKYII